MKAAQINKYGHIDVIEINNIEKPRLSRNQVLVEVYASSINPVDTAIREGRMSGMYQLQLPITLGGDISGIVSEVGDDVMNFRPGDKVFGQSYAQANGTGAFAEFTAVPANMISRMPSNVSFTEAAVLPLTGISAIQTLIDHLKLQRGQKILIHGGAGGIGTIAIQIAKHLGAYVAATTTGKGVDHVKKLGADLVIDYKKQQFETLIHDYDAVFDTVAGETYNKSFKVLKKGGTIASMLMQPEKALMDQYGVHAIYSHTKVDTQSLDKLRMHIEDRVITPHIAQIYPLDKIRDAFKLKETTEPFIGKIAIEVKK